MGHAITERYLNEGFSGGEREAQRDLQMALLAPDIAVLDETDSGPSTSTRLGVVSRGIEEVRRERPNLGILLITTTSASRSILVPDFVHVLPRRTHRGERRPGARPSPSRPKGSTPPHGRRSRRTMSTERTLDVERVKKDFAILRREIAGKRSSPRLRVRRAEAGVGCSKRSSTATRYYYANIHRGVYTIGKRQRTRSRPRARESPSS